MPQIKSGETTQKQLMFHEIEQSSQASSRNEGISHGNNAIKSPGHTLAGFSTEPMQKVIKKQFLAETVGARDLQTDDNQDQDEKLVHKYEQQQPLFEGDGQEESDMNYESAASYTEAIQDRGFEVVAKS